MVWGQEGQTDRVCRAQRRKLYKQRYPTYTNKVHSRKKLDHFNGNIFIKENEFLSKKISTENNSSPEGSIGEFHINV